jgi:two-component sensor histidine kinase
MVLSNPLSDSRRSFRARLVLLSMGILLPAAISASWLLWAQSQETNRQYRQQLLSTARALSSAVDHKVAEAVAVNETLATSGRIGSGEFGEFRTRTVQALKGKSAWVVLSDASGRQLVNTKLPADSPLPTFPERPENIAIARDTGGSRISDLTTGAVVQRRILAVDTPVRSGGRTFNLSYIFEPAALLPIFQEQRLRPGWLVTLIDRKGRVIARSRGQDRFLGQMATGDLLTEVRASKEGVLTSRSLDGVRMLTAFSRSDSTGWTLITAVPLSEMQASTGRALGRVGLLSAALLAVSLMLAWALSRGLNRQVRSVVDDAAALAGGAVTPPREGLIAELAAIQGAISRASHDLAARERRHALMVNELNHRVRNTLATVQAIALHTFRDKAAPEALADFTGRLKALASAHELLSEVNWSDTTVADVLRRCQPLADERISTEGPEIALPAQAGVALCMIFHELLTNSLKYGALSASAGRVRIDWAARDGACRLTWRETGGPPVSPPERKGFGGRLIERLVKQDLEGSSALNYRPEGLTFTASFRTSVDGRWDPGLHVEGETRDG